MPFPATLGTVNHRGITNTAIARIRIQQVRVRIRVGFSRIKLYRDKSKLQSESNDSRSNIYPTSVVRDQQKGLIFDRGLQLPLPHVPVMVHVKETMWMILQGWDPALLWYMDCRRSRVGQERPAVPRLVTGRE
jgi:hypothetical protein